MFSFSVLHKKHPFTENVVQKIKTVWLRWILVSRLIQICSIRWGCSFRVFWTENNLFGKIWFIMNSKVVFTFFVLDRKYPFLSKFGPKNENCLFKMKLSNSMAMFIWPAMTRKHTIWTNLVQKIQIICWGWNLASIVIRICWIWWTQNTLFG